MTRQRLSLFEKIVVASTAIASSTATYNIIRQAYLRYVNAKAYAGHLEVSIAGVDIDVVPAAISACVGLGVIYLASRGIKADKNAIARNEILRD